ncbi:1959_t:CDS:2 [Entrophospora sp. SA101]|nr:1959_t:CDS:2 [Entrophospora sp. SA101]
MFNIVCILFLHFKMAPTSLERYIGLLRKTGKIPVGHSSVRPRKLTSKKRRRIGKILKHNHFTTADELKAKLEENDPELEISERTTRRELKNLGFTQQAKDNRLSFLIQMFRNTLLSWSRMQNLLHLW